MGEGVTTRPSFDPRRELRAELHDLGPMRVWRQDAAGVLTERHERRLAMSVFIDGDHRIDHGLVVTGGQPLVALHECGSCGLYECNLAEDYAARVRRVGPYVVWLTIWSELHCFGLDRYREVFGDASALSPPGEADYGVLGDDVARAGALVLPDGRTLAFDLEHAPDTPLARLGAWRGGPGVEAVLPPPEAVELPSVAPGEPSAWIDVGRRAAYLPGVFVLPVWITGPDVDALVAATLEPPPAPASPAPSSPRCRAPGPPGSP